MIRKILQVEATNRSALELLRDTAKALNHNALIKSVNEALDEIDGKQSIITQPSASKFEQKRFNNAQANSRARN